MKAQHTDAGVADKALALRTLPHNPDAEKAVLGAIFADNRAYEKLSGFLRPDHFALTHHGSIFAAVAALIERGQVADPITLKQYFEQDETLAEIGGPAYLSELANSATTVINAGQYGELIADLYGRRTLIQTGEDLIAKAYDADVAVTSADILQEHMEGLGRVAPECLAGAAQPSRALFWSDLEKLPRSEYLVKGVLDAGCLSEIFGPTSCGKSFLATDLGLHIALGWDWNGRKVRQAGVLYVNAEGGTAIITRLDAFQRHHNVDLAEIPFAVVIEPTTLLDPAGVNQVIADAAKVPGLGLVEIDTAARVMPGGDEGAEAMSAFVAACDRIRAETGAAVNVIHHTGKDTSKGSRGSTVLPFGADTVIEVTRDTTTNIASARLNKQRDGAIGPLLNFTLKVIEVGTDVDGDTITSCVIEYTDRKPAKTTTPTQRRAIEVLHNVLIEQGKPAPDAKHYPAGARVADVATWRDSLFKAGVLDKDASNPRQPFKRLRDGMIERGLIGEWDGLVWAVSN